LRISLQTKILIPVLGILIAAPATMVVLVDRYLTDVGQKDAQQALNTAESVFRQLLDNHSRDLLLRFRNAADESSYKAIAPLAADHSQAAEATIRNFLSDKLAEYDDDTAVMLIVPSGSKAPVGARRGVSFGVDEFARAAAAASAEALGGGTPAPVQMSLRGAVFDVVSVPILLPEGGQPVAALTVGIRLADKTVKELKELAHTEILLVADDQIVVSTLAGVDPAWLREIAVQGTGRSGAGKMSVPFEPVADPTTGEHFLALAENRALGGAEGGFHYVLLSSLKESRLALADTQQVLLDVGIASILLSVAVVWFSVRRLIHPLSELRDTAEAVGRGDFSRRITRFSNDECGDLAETFNRMTANLQASLAELEKTVETLKATQAQLVQSGKLSAVGQFVAGVAHELNNPLTAVIGFSDLLSQTVADEKLRPQLAMIAKSAHRCHKIVQNLLSFARQHAPERKFTQINATIDEVLEFMAYDLRTSDIKVVRDFEATLPPIWADPHQLQQVFVNIVGNARQAIGAARASGQIMVRTRVVAGFVRIEITDDGPGISPENLAKIFDPFFTTKPQGQGTGLGLSLVYGMIQEHGGTIVAKSELGRGATFTVDLPISTEAPVLRGESAQAGGRLARAAKPRGTSVLVVDDEDWILSLARELLTWDGHEVETARGGQEALDILRRRHFDVVVSDWKMPGMNGIQFYERLLVEHPRLANRIVFTSGDVINDGFKDFLLRNGKTCLSKPFPIGEFQDAIASMLSTPSTPPIPTKA